MNEIATSLSRSPTAVGESFDRIAAKIEGYSKRFYLLSYCSPARAGVHQLTVRPFTPEGLTGDISYRFNADGFTPNCDPNRKPAFDVRNPRTGKTVPKPR